MLYTSKVMEKDTYFNPKELELSDKRFLEKLEENSEFISRNRHFTHTMVDQRSEKARESHFLQCDL